MDSFFPSELISLLNSNTRGRIELGRIDLMKSFSFFEVDEKEAQMVVQSLNRANWNGRKVSVEIAGEENAEGRRGGSGEKRSNDRKSWASSDKRSDRAPHASRDERPSRAPKAERAPKANAIKSDKPSREERGYVGERGKKDDWQQFFSDEGGSKGFKGEEPDFSEEGWARRKKK